ncbi:MULTISPECIES: RidA family protein [unclassified Caulobacter]|jgi:enamine deaminase RidA (YjgF/YER057c/UK114 family)|uniref:RidA family protein n=1 Tax=unclassified Caulobacter TaxID=2648921 RepID=UPI0006FA79FD|nr:MULTISPECIES: RidA family protein [unclassified Caulobacter]KQV62763.1 enamine deaminase RidA [Caulobacter sp. Root342]KQV71896.1 enamine deaminase RidA [Caulobacter sp. Root343]
METVTHNPTEGVYTTTDDYVHAIEVRNPQRLLYVAGTMGLEANGEPGATLERQLELLWDNLRAILKSADMTVDNIVRLTSYLRDVAYVEANGAARVKALGDRRIPTTAIIVQTLSEDWLVELEIVAAA